MELIWAAGVTTIGTIIVALIQRTRRENNRDHAENAKKLDRISQAVDKVADRLGDHIDWHMDRKGENQ